MSYRLLQKSKVSSSFEHNESENNYVLRSTDHIYFVICNSCYLAFIVCYHLLLFQSLLLQSDFNCYFGQS